MLFQPNEPHSVRALTAIISNPTKNIIGLCLPVACPINEQARTMPGFSLTASVPHSK